MTTDGLFVLPKVIRFSFSEPWKTIHHLPRSMITCRAKLKKIITNRVFITIASVELSTLKTLCEIERTNLLTILTIFVKSVFHWSAGFLSTAIWSNFLFSGGFIIWFYDCLHQLSPLYLSATYFDDNRIQYREAICYVDPRTRQKLIMQLQLQVILITWNIFVGDPDTDCFSSYTSRQLKLTSSIE